MLYKFQEMYSIKICNYEQNMQTYALTMSEFLNLSKIYKDISQINKIFPKNMHFPSNYFIHKSIKQLLTLYLIQLLY